MTLVNNGSQLNIFQMASTILKNSMEISKQVQGRSFWNSLIFFKNDVKDDIFNIITIVMAMNG
jgi:hypothetical protein